MSKLYFVRHGESEWNVADKICGRTDIPLTKRGHEQAVETGKKIVADGIKADERNPGTYGTETDRAEFWRVGGDFTAQCAGIFKGKERFFEPLWQWRIHVSGGTSDLWTFG
mgnify:CR=1 FL=1